MKKYILPVIAIITLTMFSCNEEAAQQVATETKTEAVKKVTTIKNEVKDASKVESKVVPNTQAIASKSTSIKVDRMVHDFGVLTTKTPVKTEFTITNTGKEPLIITNAKGSCGCTVPDWPKEPIAPGSTGSMKVTFNPKGNGSQSKTVTIMANTEPKNTVLTIKSTVDIKK